jgi:ATP-dependent helicase HepA
MLGAEKGNSCFAEWPDDRTTAFYLEAVFVLESIAPPQLHIDRFLPATPLRILVDHTGKDLSATIPRTRLRQELKAGEPHDVLDNPELREDLFPRLLAVAQGIAEGRVEGIVTSARQEMTGQLQSEIRRIRELQKVNRSVRPEEIQLLEDQHQELDAVLQRARLRLDAVRFVYRGT